MRIRYSIGAEQFLLRLVELRRPPMLALTVGGLRCDLAVRMLTG